MPADDIAWPRKTRELRSVKFDSDFWNDFVFRNYDIVIATYEKAGTTWVQQIVAQLVFGGADGIDLNAISPWLDLRIPSKAETFALLEAQTHRRIIKTHLPVDALTYSPKAKYLYVGRDGRDVAWSLYNHLTHYTPQFLDQLNSLPGRSGPPLEKPAGDAKAFFVDWLTHDGRPIGPFWGHIRSWWSIRDLPNLLLLHYARLKADLAGEIRRIAAFLEIPVDPQRWPAILEHCGFAHMKANAEQFAPRGGASFEGGAQTFIHRGTNGRWRDILSDAESAAYENTALEKLGPACAHWLAAGQRSD
jgi:aryl sulfotransferase